MIVYYLIGIVDIGVYIHRKFFHPKENDVKKTAFHFIETTPVWGKLINTANIGSLYNTMGVDNKNPYKPFISHLVAGTQYFYVNNSERTYYIKTPGEIPIQLPAYSTSNFISKMVATMSNETVPSYEDVGVFLIKINILQSDVIREKLRTMIARFREAESLYGGMISKTDKDKLVRQHCEWYDIVKGLNKEIFDNIDTYNLQSSCLVECYKLASVGVINQKTTVIDSKFGIMVSSLKPEDMPRYPSTFIFNREKEILKIISEDVKPKQKDLVITYSYRSSKSLEPKYIKVNGVIRKIYPVGICSPDEEGTIKIKHIFYDSDTHSESQVFEETIPAEELNNRGFFDSEEGAETGGFTKGVQESVAIKAQQELSVLKKKYQELEKERDSLKIQLEAVKQESASKEAHIAALNDTLKLERERNDRVRDVSREDRKDQHEERKFVHEEKKQENDTILAKIKKNAGVIGLVTGVVALVTTVVKVVFSPKKAISSLLAFF